MLHLSRGLVYQCLGVGLAGSLLLAGCGGTRGDLARVRGNVKLDGQPLADALVEFIPQGEKGVVSMGRTDSSGNYDVMATRTAAGASRGVNKVRITTYEILDLGGKQKVVKERVPTKYNSATELTVTVEPRSNTLNFDLSTAGGKVEKASESPARIQ
ncbi:MAG TPA: carboxypeptidase regulatory-like domain-containing protein [Pirellulaceae bacterium]|nr:carboxypeptidase regulatory-like domain-containing protein [Pirellulaceae bacterium]